MVSIPISGRRGWRGFFDANGDGGSLIGEIKVDLII